MSITCTKAKARIGLQDGDAGLKWNLLASQKQPPDADLQAARCESLRRRIRRKRSELGAARHRFRSLIVDNGEAIMVISDQGFVRFANLAAETLFDCGPAKLLGQRFRQLTMDDDICALDLPDSDRGPITVDVLRRSLVWRGETCLAVTLRDVSQRRRSEKALLEATQAAEFANRMKSQFLANMSHELRTPLNSIIGFSEIIRHQLFGPLGNEKYRDYMEDIHKSGSYLLQLINDLLDLSKAEAGELELREEVFDIVGCFHHAIRTVAATAKKKHLSFDTDLPAGTLAFRGDEAKIMQITLNLLSNAIKFTPAHGKISLRLCTTAQGTLRLSVSDTGIGIPPDKLQKVFQPFAQVRSGEAASADGTGLGLTLTKRLVALHGGTIKLSSSIGVGSTVAVALPAKRLVGHGDKEPLLPG